MPEQDEPLGVGNRQRPQQHGVDDGEDGDAGADAESDGQHGDPCEGRIAQERPEASPRLTDDRIDPCAEPNVPHLLGHLVDPAELETGGAPGLVRRHPRRALLLDQHVEVAVEFLPELVLDLIAMEETAQEMATPGAQRGEEGHPGSPVWPARPLGVSILSLSKSYESNRRHVEIQEDTRIAQSLYPTTSDESCFEPENRTCPFVCHMPMLKRSGPRSTGLLVDS